MKFPAGDHLSAASIQSVRVFRRMTLLLLLCLLTILGSRAGVAQVGSVRTAVLDEQNWDALVPGGKEVDAIYGDIVLQNQHLTAVIAQPLPTRNANMTVRNVGGCLLDLTLRDSPGDQLSAFYPGRRKSAFASYQTNGSAASSTAPDGRVTSAEAGAVTVSSPGTASEPRCDVTYSLNDTAQALTITSVWTNTTNADVTLTLEDDLRADGGKEDMVKSPNGTHEVFWFHDIFWQQAYGVRAAGYQLRCNSNARESVLVYEPDDGRPVTVAPGATYTLRREIFPAADLPGVLAVHDLLSDGTQSHVTTIRIHDGAGQAVPGARLEIRNESGPRGTTVADGDGVATCLLPSGEYTIDVTHAGAAILPKGALKVLVNENTDLSIEAGQLRLGNVEAEITDAEGRPIPVKVQFTGTDGAPTPDWGPETAEHFVRNVAYSPDGRFSRELQAGRYDVIISHGPEYDAVFTQLIVAPGKAASLRAKLTRVVDSRGWVSADFHSHSSPSGDNTASQLGRVLNLAAEHIEFAPCTEHNRISTYGDHIASQDLGAFLATVSGMELTGSPLPLNHQNSFPLLLRPRTQDGGAPVTDSSPETQIERLSAWDNNSRKLIQQNHPDIGWLFYDRDGDQKSDEGYARAFQHMDVVEVHPIDPILDLTPLEIRDGKPIGNQTIFNWLQLLNQGFRIYGVVNTDAHYNFHGSGGLRLWIRSSTDDPSKIRADEMLDASEAGRIVMSNGPFLEASLQETGRGEPVVAGSDLAARTGKLTANVRVQCPNWFDIDTVFVLVNGRQRDDLTWTRDADPDSFGSGPVKFEQSFDFEVPQDSHVIFVAGHRSERLGDVLGTWGTQHPAAVTNPIFVDVDGDGFTANQDTLDSPLPVKFVAP